jgi:malonate transporter MadL subunit
VHYWGAIYIPVVVAMAMQQNVVAALKGGPVALIAAVGSVVLCGLFVSFINRMEPETDAQEEGQ